MPLGFNGNIYLHLLKYLRIWFMLSTLFSLFLVVIVFLARNKRPRFFMSYLPTQLSSLTGNTLFYNYFAFSLIHNLYVDIIHKLDIKITLNYCNLNYIISSHLPNIVYTYKIKLSSSMEISRWIPDHSCLLSGCPQAAI